MTPRFLQQQGYLRLSQQPSIQYVLWHLTRTNKANILKVRLAETFLKIAESLRKTRGSLMR
jgi:hypothetical protein